MEAAAMNRIIEIVKEMNAQGMSTTEIKSNLKQMGVEEEDIKAILEKAKLGVNLAEIHSKAEQAISLLESGEHLKPTMGKLEKQEEHLERIHTHLGEMHEKQIAVKEDVGDVKRELEEIKASINELKPLLASIKRLNEDLIKINRKMLMKLGME